MIDIENPAAARSRVLRIVRSPIQNENTGPSRRLRRAVQFFNVRSSYKTRADPVYAESYKFDAGDEF